MSGASMFAEEIDGVRTGQIWESCDSRRPMRRLLIVTLWTVSRRATVRNEATGRMGSVSLAYLRPGTRGYRLVTDVP